MLVLSKDAVTVVETLGSQQTLFFFFPLQGSFFRQWSQLQQGQGEEQTYLCRIISEMSSLLWSSQLSRNKLVFKRNSSIQFVSPSATFHSRCLVSCACGQPRSCLCLRTNGNWSSSTKSWAWKEKVSTLIVLVPSKAVYWSAVCTLVCVKGVCSYTVPWGKEFLVCFSRLHHIPQDCRATVCSGRWQIHTREYAP